MTEPAYLLDSNICIYILGGLHRPLLDRVQQMPVGSLCMSAIVHAEVRLGIGREHPDQLDKLERLTRIAPVLPFDLAAANAYALLPFRRNSFDGLIAAHAIATGLTLVTANVADFAGFPDLKVEDWTRP